jgi:hypothetical protein
MLTSIETMLSNNVIELTNKAAFSGDILIDSTNREVLLINIVIKLTNIAAM